MSAFLTKRSFCLVACCLLALLVSSTASAGIVLSIDPATRQLAVPAAGTSQFTVGVQMSADSGTQLVKTYNLVIDLGAPAGQGLPQGWSIVSATQRFFGFTEAVPAFDSNFANPAEGDLIVSDGNLLTAVSFDTTPVTLFDFTVSIDNTAVAGDYTAVFLNQSLLAVSDAADTRISNAQMQLNSGAIRVTAVPEPSTFGMVGVILAFSSICRRARRRNLG